MFSIALDLHAAAAAACCLLLLPLPLLLLLLLLLLLMMMAYAAGACNGVACSLGPMECVPKIRMPVPF